MIAKYGHLQAAGLLERTACYEAAHPVPDEAGVKATDQVSAAES